MSDGGGDSRGRLGDAVFYGFFALFLLTALFVLATGAGAAVAAYSDGLHDQLHRWGLADTIWGRMAEGMGQAAHGTGSGPSLALDFGFSAFNIALALFLVWLRPRERTARLLAIGMVGTAAVFNLQAHAVYEATDIAPWQHASHDVFHIVAALAYIYALLLFPDGRLVPRWRGWALAGLYLPATVMVGVAAYQVEDTSRTVALILYFGLLTPVAGVAAQAYRYRRPLSGVERAQARLAFWALSPAVLVALYVLTQTESAFEPGRAFAGRDLPVIPVELFRVFQPVFALIPVALFVGILRFRLWNIDRVISRTLVYGALAGFVTAVYVGVVVGLGQLLFGAPQRPGNLWLSIVATGIIAVAFEPMKARVQRYANRLVYGRRATPYEVMSELASRMSGSVAVEDMLSRVARILAEGMAATRAQVWLVIGSQLRLAASWPVSNGEAPSPLPMTGDDLPELGASAAVPVRHHGDLLGALVVYKPATESVTPTEEKLLADVGAQAGLVLRNVRLTSELMERLEELRASRQRLVAAQDEERRRIERDLHDGAQQQLVALMVQLGLAERMVGDHPVSDLLHGIKEATGEALDTLRDLARGIYPPLLAAEGLATAITAHGRKMPFKLEIKAEGIHRYPQGIESAVYFSCLEALQNASKYAEASTVVIEISYTDEVLSFTVTDDGRGFDPEVTPPGMGTRNMADRIEALDGTLEIDSAPGRGTTVRGRIPCPQDQVRPIAEPAAASAGS